MTPSQEFIKARDDLKIQRRKRGKARDRLFKGGDLSKEEIVRLKAIIAECDEKAHALTSKLTELGYAP